MAKNITLLGASYPDVPAVDLPQTGGGTARFVDPSPTTAQDADVGQGKIYFKADGSQSVGTASGGSGGDYVRTLVCPQQTFSNAAWTDYAMLADTPRLVDGDDYIITYDGTEYFCTCEELWGSDRFLGSTSITWGGQSTDIIFPFCVEDWNNLSGPAVHAIDNGSHTIKIERLELLNSGTTLVPKTISANGVYDPEDDGADGYSEITVALPAGTAGTPTATKGTVSNHSMDITPSVTNTAGVISTETKTGTPVTVSASELVSGSETKNQNGTYNVTNLAELVVNVPSGGGLDLLQTTSLGALQTTATSATDTGKTISIAQSTGWQNYDLLVVDISVDSLVNGRHTSTVSLVLLTGTSNVATKNTYTVGSNKWNSKLNSSGTGSTRQSTSAYGVYIYSASASSNTLTLTVYYRYNSNSTGTLNGNYTARIYGVKLYDLIGG